MIDHGTKCNGQPCTCGAKQEQEHHHHLVPEVIPGWTNMGWRCTTCGEHLNSKPVDTKSRMEAKPLMQYRYEQQPADCPPYCTRHNHEEMGG